jgi:hypothetical protein
MNCLMTQASKKASSNTPQIALLEMAYLITCHIPTIFYYLVRKLLSVWPRAWQISLYASFW